MTRISAERLRTLSLFEGLSAEEVHALAAACVEADYAAGETILKEGQESRALWMLIEGTVEVDLEVPRAGERVIAELRAPSIFGEISFFHASPHSATVKSREAARLLRLDRSKFDELVSQHSTAALRLGIQAAEILAARVQKTDRWVGQMLSLQQDAKVHDAWRNFRQTMGHGISGAGPFIGLGANWS